MDIAVYITAGQAIISPATPEDIIVVDGTLPALAKVLAQHFRGLLRPVTVKKPRGMRGYSFHWSNAQAAWSVIGANDPAWGTDGAEFLVYFNPGLMSLAKRLWTIKDMQTLATILPPHPGYAGSVEGWERGVSASRVASRFLSQK
jgi:hypothetical protein